MKEAMKEFGSKTVGNVLGGLMIALAVAIFLISVLFDNSDFIW